MITRSLSRAQTLLLAAAVLAVLLNVFLALRPTPVDAATQARADLLQSAEARVPAMLTFNGQDPEGDLVVATANATPDFRDTYAGIMRDAIDKSRAAEMGLVNEVELKSVGIIESKLTSGTVLVVVRQTRTVAGQDPALQLGRVVVSLEKAGSDWLVSGLQPI